MVGKQSMLALVLAGLVVHTLAMRRQVSEENAASNESEDLQKLIKADSGDDDDDDGFDDDEDMFIPDESYADEFDTGTDEGVASEMKFQKTVSNELSSQAMPLCFPGLVKRTCSQFYDNGRTYKPAKELLQELYAASDQSINAFFDELGVTDTVKCRDLCSDALMYAWDNGYIVPKEHDKGCAKVSGQWNCDIDVSPDHLVVQQKIDLKSTDLPDNGKGVKTTSLMEGGQSIFAQRVGGGASAMMEAAFMQGDGPVDQTPEQMLMKTMRLFRIYIARPDDDQKIIMGEGGGSLVDVNSTTQLRTPEQAIELGRIQAQAWVSTVIGELNRKRTRRERLKWFGGPLTDGKGLTDEQIRQRIIRVFNFMDRELAEMFYFYPADISYNTACGDSTLAYVWKRGDDETKYRETQHPRCQSFSQAKQKACALDAHGRYIVYLCKYWYEKFGEIQRTSTFVHEAAHHTGPTDVSYDVSKIKTMPQADQLNNAANYQRFGESVTLGVWGCADQDTVYNIPYTCGANRGPCDCEALESLCKDPKWGRSISQQCKATCGLCKMPASSRPAPVDPCLRTRRQYAHKTGTCHNAVFGADYEWYQTFSWLATGNDCQCDDGYRTGGANPACNGPQEFNSEALANKGCCCVPSD